MPYSYNNYNNYTNTNRIRVSTMTIGELKAANSSMLNGFFEWKYIEKATSDEVRERLVRRRPDVYTW